MMQWRIPARRAAITVPALVMGTLFGGFSTANAQDQNLLERWQQRLRQRIDAGATVAPSAVAPAAATTERMTLGIEAEERGATPPYAVLVHSVRPGSPAAQAGIQPGDVIEQVDGRRVGRISEITDSVGRKQAGDQMRLILRREGDPLEVVAVFAASMEPATPAEPGVSVEPATQDSPATPRVARPRPGAGRLGVTVENVATAPPGAGVPVRRGAVVVEVAPETPADVIGIGAGNVIVSIDGVLIQEAADLIDQISTTVPGQTIEIAFYRGRELVRTNLRLAGPDGTIAQDPPPRRAADATAPGQTPGAPGAVLQGLGSALGGLFGSGPPGEGPTAAGGAPSNQAPASPSPSGPSPGSASPANQSPEYQLPTAASSALEAGEQVGGAVPEAGGIESVEGDVGAGAFSPSSAIESLMPPSLELPPSLAPPPAASTPPIPVPPIPVPPIPAPADALEPTETLSEAAPPSEDVASEEDAEVQRLRDEIRAVRQQLEALEQRLRQLQGGS